MNMYDSSLRRGKIVSGYGGASLTIPRQLNSLALYDREINACFPATINVELESDLSITDWPITTEPIAWSELHPDFKEVFLLAPITLHYQDHEYRAWIYRSKTIEQPNRHNKRYFEILAKKVPLTNEKECAISLPTEPK